MDLSKSKKTDILIHVGALQNERLRRQNKALICGATLLFKMR